MKIIIAIGIISAWTVFAHAQITGSIAGRVCDVESGEPLPGANVQILGTFIGASAGSDGYYRIQSVAPGSYDLRVSYIGYKAEVKSVLVQSKKIAKIDFDIKWTTLQTDQIVITGSRQPENLASAVASINILGADEIKRRDSFRIDEALIAVPGVTIVGENVNVRGGSGYNRLGGNRTLVLLDEVPILTSDLGAANWNIIPVTEIDHIEVLKGAASSLYGSGALSGVINIMTKKPSSTNTFSFRLSSGIYDKPSVAMWRWSDKLRYYNRTDLGYSRSIGPVGVRLAVSRHQSTGDRQNGRFERWYFTGKTDVQLSSQSTLTIFSTYSTENREFFLQWLEQDRALEVPQSELGNRYQLDGFVGYAVYHKLFSPTLSTKIRMSYNQQLVGIPVNITNAFTPAVGLSGELQVNWKPHTNHSLSLGVDYKHDEVESEFYGKRRADGVSPYIQEIWKLSQLVQFNAGLRLDTYTLVGDSVEKQLSPKIGFSYQPFTGTILHFSFGRGFRAATVVERFISAGSRDFKALPNPTLKPERSTLFDVGVRQKLGEALYAELTVFSSRYDNLIEPTLSSDLTARFVNYPKARIQGVETEFRWEVWRDMLFLHTSATWMDPRELEADEPLLYRPRFVGYVTPSLHLGRFVFEADYRYMSRIEKVAVYPLDERVPTKVWDVRLIYKWKWLTLQFSVRNAVNYNYTVSERVLGEIRNFALTMSGDL